MDIRIMKEMLVTTYFLVLLSLNTVLAFESFEVNFDSPVSFSQDNSMEFIGQIPPLKEFTSCHWEKKMYT